MKLEIEQVLTLVKICLKTTGMVVEMLNYQERSLLVF